MKRTLLSLLAVLGLGTMATAQFSVYKDGKVVYTMEDTPDYVDFTYHKPLKGTANGHEWVDMGLSVKWSSVNIGASSPEQAGNYYAWGETETKKNYYWSTYAHMKIGQFTWYNINKYQVDDHSYEGLWYKDAKYYNNGGKTVLDKADDAAAVNWQGDWMMPTIADWEELQNNCTIEWTSDYNADGSNKAGYVVKSKIDGNYNSIFLPAAGCLSGSSLRYAGTYGFYWSSSLYEVSSCVGSHVYFYSDNFVTDNSNIVRCVGQSVRPVCPTQGITNGHVAVDLGLPSGKLWASCNVGASAPEESGSLFAWGETEVKNYCSWATYTGDPVQFIGDDKTVIEQSDDVANRTWGEEWRMPTHAEWNELYNNTTRTWTNDYNGTGVSGYILTSTVEGYAEASIFLPAAGRMGGNEIYGEGSYGYYWSSSLEVTRSEYGYDVAFTSRHFAPNVSELRAYGQSVRPVCPDAD